MLQYNMEHRQQHRSQRYTQTGSHWANPSSPLPVGGEQEVPPSCEAPSGVGGSGEEAGQSGSWEEDSAMVQVGPQTVSGLCGGWLVVETGGVSLD